MRELELKYIIENNELLIQFHDLTAQEEKDAKNEIEKAKKELKKLLAKG